MDDNGALRPEEWRKRRPPLTVQSINLLGVSDKPREWVPKTSELDTAQPIPGLLPLMRNCIDMRAGVRLPIDKRVGEAAEGIDTQACLGPRAKLLVLLKQFSNSFEFCEECSRNLDIGLDG